LAWASSLDLGMAASHRYSEGKMISGKKHVFAAEGQS